MAVVERTFVIDESIAKQLDELVLFDEQSEFVSEVLAKQIYQINKEKLLKKMQTLRQSDKVPDGISTTDMIYQLRQGGQV
ncbi:hypothetical protein LP123_11270 [Moraxella bovis]|uniref:Uncharacterized protein n=1 Tax=Moraxella bovis TaxID=476 RepID=A0AAQ2Q9K2_MORBO|nr:hypothetical protein [Moraxella bovis]AWY21014.1 hypothetical protein DQF64_11320 [Moraxella bovis]OOR90297.1 hypothetical protein B0182_05280 [Moraxella bovis]UYZ76321.1 hypothetical protein LP093_03080 [Moraxella bovis]UYZ77727.1 hypothetical protein LP115_10725 [Moraxella bovis]UYZ81764.1 hypothetical protein LP113_03240 [Moraxella bovis]